MGSDGQAAYFEVADLARIGWRFGRSTQTAGRSFSKTRYPAGAARSQHALIDTSAFGNEIDTAPPVVEDRRRALKGNFLVENSAW